MTALEAAGRSAVVRRAAYASDPEASRGRLHREPESPTRSAFQRDRDRIIHSAAFRRLQYKTQVFVYHEGDHYRTRLTHSLEVAQIARSLCRSLGLDEDLAEALALAHDLGHTPFGHAGEEALDAAMAGFGGFDHNGQTLRIITKLEARYAAFDGLNLTWETLEGIAKHNGPLAAGRGDVAGLPWAVAEYAAAQDLELHTWPGIEAQVAALSDDIAYHSHDVDDGLRAGLFAVADLAPVKLVGPILSEVARRHPGLDPQRLIHESKRRLIDAMVADVLAETRRRLDAARPRSAAEVRALGRPVVGFSAAMADDNRALKEFLFERMYRHERVNRMTARARRVVTELFAALIGDPAKLPPDWQARTDGAGGTATARRVADYIAGMTDRFALGEHRRLCPDSDAQS
jgi:dGTPase